MVRTLYVYNYCTWQIVDRISRLRPWKITYFEASNVYQKKTHVGLLVKKLNRKRNQSLPTWNGMYLYNRSFTDKNVLRFHIPVDNTIGMQVIQRFYLKMRKCWKH